MKMRFVPRLCTCSVICCWAPRPMLMSVITAATPMITPSMVSTPRSLFARSARRATRTASSAFISLVLHRQLREHLDRPHRVLDGLVLVHPTVADLHHAPGVL